MMKAFPGTTSATYAIRLAWVHPSCVLFIWGWNFSQLCIHYSLRPRVSSRLTLGGRAFPRKPYPYGDMDFDHVYRYSCLNSHFCLLTHVKDRTLSYRSFEPTISVYYLSPDHFRRKISRWVSYYALFKWWLLLSQHPHCL